MIRFEAGMYLIADVPERATALHFSILNTAEFDCVVLSNSCDMVTRTSSVSTTHSKSEGSCETLVQSGSRQR